MSDIIHIQAAHNVGTIIRATLPKARVHDWWIIAPGIETSLQQFTTVDEDAFAALGTPFVHGYCVGIQDMPRSHLASNLKFDAGFTLNVWGLYEWKLGTNTHNSEHVFVENLKAIQDALSRAPQLQTDGNFYSDSGTEGLQGHNQLNWNSLTSLKFNNARAKQVFLAQGTIEIDAYDLVTVT